MKLTLGISCGDPNGIGIEVALKAFADERLYAYFVPVLFANAELVKVHQEANDLLDIDVRPMSVEDLASFGESRKASSDDDSSDDDGSDDLPSGVYVVDCFEGEVTVEFGRITPEGGAFAKTSLDAATDALAAGHLDALVTAPINKSAMQQSSFGFPGHTEYLEAKFGQGRSLMLMVGNDDLRVAVATNHLPLRQVATGISPTILQNKIAMLHHSLERDFGIHGPLIAVLGLNPHAGDEGAIGSEETETIRPAVVAMKERGIEVFGPFPADGFFGSGKYREFDGILAMYHDQGLVPFKTLSFGGGVNFTAGLKVVRTSPDHGTALDIAGQGKASPDSFREAAFLAREVFMQRNGYDEAHANPLVARRRGPRKKR